MKLILNNRLETINTNNDCITITDLLRIQNFTYKMLIVKINDVLVKKDDYSTATIKDSDNVQVIHLISGG